ncbi:MAG: polysaccharide biosynthesis/export family protein, partial [Alphaproteobacteria bacterium]
LIEMDPRITNYLVNIERLVPPTPWPKSGAGPEVIKVNIGDTLTITVYEAQSGGLFIPPEAGVRPGNYVSIPPQTVDKSGQITIPYIGAIDVAGKTPIEISANIAQKLQSRAIDPQVVVSMDDRKSSEVSIVGQVKNSTRFPLSYNGEKILDAISRAGGPDIPGHQALVTLQRGGKEYTLAFDELLKEPSKNIYLRSGDTVYLYKEAKSYMVYGASGINGTYEFDKREMLLSEALGKSSGLKDTQADPAEVYVYRYENAGNLKDIERLGGIKAPETTPNDKNPVIYRFDLRKPDGFFVAQQFPMKNGDIVYIANAETVDISKFLDFLGLTARTVNESDDAYFN